MNENGFCQVGLGPLHMGTLLVLALRVSAMVVLQTPSTFESLTTCPCLHKQAVDNGGGFSELLLLEIST